MSDKTNPASASELKTMGVLVEKGVRITEKSSIDALSQRGYGTSENDVIADAASPSILRGEYFVSPAWRGCRSYSTAQFLNPISVTMPRRYRLTSR